MLKRPRPHERGVIVIKYSEAIETFAAIYDLPRLVREYLVVLEPSGAGYADPRYSMFDWERHPGIIQAPFAPDAWFARRCFKGLVASRLGPGDWVDTRVFRPLAGAALEYDLIVVAAWQPLKRHRDVLDAVSTLRSVPLRLLLVGYPWRGFARTDIERMIRRRGLQRQCTVMERVPPPEVNRMLNSCRVQVLMTKKEGHSKALYEGFHAGVPCIVRQGIEGIRREDIGTKTGVYATVRSLPKTILAMLEARRSFDPASWAAEHTGYALATRRLNSEIRTIAESLGEDWTEDIVQKTNRPNLQYAEPESRDLTLSCVDHLRSLLRIECP